VELSSLCNKVKALGYFGSFARDEYVEGISDVNVFAITSDKSVLLELASEGYSPLVVSEEELQGMCREGDPICYYLLMDSKVVCGDLKANFVKTPYTCERLRKQIPSFLKMSIEGYKRGDEVSALNNAYKSFRSLIQWKKCLVSDNIPLSRADLEESCRELGLECDVFEDLLRLRDTKTPITIWSINKLYNVLKKYVELPFPSPAEEAFGKR
jgi:hypothetical protein